MVESNFEFSDKKNQNQIKIHKNTIFKSLKMNSCWS